MVLSILISVLVVSAVGAALAAAIVVSQHYLADYGPCTIDINDERQLTVEGGRSLLASLTAEKIFIPSACGGRGTCGLCKLKVLDGAGPLLLTEEPYLDAKERASSVRLSCQIKVRNDLRIEIPQELFAIREFVATCGAITDLTDDMKQFRFELIEPDTIEYIPGQYVQLRTPPYEGSREEVYRAYSISSDPADKKVIELIIRLVPGGICTTYCFQHLKVGDEVRFNGPYGGFRLSETAKPIVFVAGGSGMAPIKCILHHMRNTNNHRKAVFYFGANVAKELFLTETMRAFEKELSDFTYVPVVSAPGEDESWEGELGLVTEALGRGLGDAGDSEAYLCGSPGMIDAAVAVLRNLGVPNEQIFYDKFE